MSREIKFRFYHPETGLMYEDTGITSLGVNNAINKANDSAYIVMQFTGLCDKNGKEIYEGDIVNCVDTNPTILEVKFIEGGFCCTSSNILPFDINSFYPSIGCRIEVIGNIYENPELLEVQK